MERTAELRGCLELWSNLVWSNTDNFLTIPTDCPQRNERMGWSGDISVFSRTATYLSYLETTIDPKTGLSSDGQLGDWLGPQNNQLGSAFLVAAYHVYDLRIMEQIAGILGKVADAGKYRELYAKRKEIFNRAFVNHDQKTLGLVGGRRGLGGQPAAPAELKLADTQTSYAVGLALGVFSEENIPQMAKNLAETVRRENKDDGGAVRPAFSLMTGFIGTAWISKALSDYGYGDLAYKLLQNNRYPSWLYAVDQEATTIWERLNGYTVENGFGGNNSMNSFNHYSFGAVGQWMMAYSLGIQRGEPGFKKFILQPQPDPTGQMTSAEGYYDSMYGRIHSAWKIQDGVLTCQATVPANTAATLYLPTATAESVKEGGKDAAKAPGITFVKYDAGKAMYELKSGSYIFTLPR